MDASMNDNRDDEEAKVAYLLIGLAGLLSAALIVWAILQ
jgi:hypothetical protein